MNWIEEGMYGVVFRARDLRTNEIVALKKLKMEREREGFPITSLREINCLLKSTHENIVHVKEVVVGGNMDKIYIVMEYVEHDLKSLMEMMKKSFTLDQSKTLLLQLLRGVSHLHENWIIHRDIKTSNLLLNHRGILKVGDFGLAREYGSPLIPYTPVVVTLWYRAPELLLGIKEYSYPIDIWSVGCVFAELIAKKPLFPAKSEAEQITKIFQELGTPDDKIWPGPPSFSQLPFSKNESPLPVPPSLFPTWPTKHEREARRKKENASPQPPQGGDNYHVQSDEDNLFHSQLCNNTNSIGFTMSASGKGAITSRLSSNVNY
ncbi:hypothetical protein HZS_5707 [Henneguya salminicola]|nr:hypothetical protein HZS_5707 [Henneguya salminicola]